MAIIEVTQDNYENEVLKSPKTVLLDFWATWCGPCRMISPILDEISKERDDVVIGKINVDEEGGLAGQFGVTAIPLLAVVKDGKVVSKTAGYRNKEAILELLNV
ncbi:thioredoxin [bacterium]|nr:thioredoxin [bacterium]